MHLLPQTEFYFVLPLPLQLLLALLQAAAAKTTGWCNISLANGSTASNFCCSWYTNAHARAVLSSSTLQLMQIKKKSSKYSIACSKFYLSTADIVSQYKRDRLENNLCTNI